MAVSEGVILTLAGGVVSGLIWLVRLEGRVNTQDERHDQHEKRHEELKEDVRYIRDRVDEIVDRM